MAFQVLQSCLHVGCPDVTLGPAWSTESGKARLHRLAGNFLPIFDLNFSDLPVSDLLCACLPTGNGGSNHLHHHCRRCQQGRD